MAEPATPLYLPGRLSSAPFQRRSMAPEAAAFSSFLKVGHSFRGRFAYAAIGKAQPIRGELALSWATHYAVSIAFAGLLVGIAGIGWTNSPSLLPAVLVGMGTVVAPLFVMQPAMGSGFAAARTPTPLRNCLRSVVNHAVFGLGLYLSACRIEWMSR